MIDHDIAPVNDSPQTLSIGEAIDLTLVNLPAYCNPGAIYLASIGETSRPTMYSGLRLVAHLFCGNEVDPMAFPWWNLRRPHLVALRSWLAENRKPATGNRILSAIRGVLRDCWRLELLPIDAYQRAIDIPTIRGSGVEQAAGRALSDGEQQAILAVLASSRAPIDVRDTAIFALCTYVGLRRAEVAALQMAAYDPGQQRLLIDGKGSKLRTVYLPGGVSEAFADWLHLRGSAPGPVFCHILKSGRILDDGIGPSAIYAIVLKLHERAQVARFTPHDLRRTFGGTALDAGVDTVTVQKLMGHASPATTSGYDRRGERAKQAAANRLHMPYRRKFSDKL